MSDSNPEPKTRVPSPLVLAWLCAASVTGAALWLHPQLTSRVGQAHLIPSPSVLALGAGMVLGAFAGIRTRLGAAAKAVSKQAIPIAIVLIGFGLELGPLFRGGSFFAGLAIVIVCMAVAFSASIGFARLLGLDARTGLLLGAGTAVCGNSAIMAVAPAVEPDEDDLALSIGVINLLGILMVFALPAVAGGLGINGTSGGVLAGLTVHAVPQAIATGEAFGAEALESATLYKLMRVALLAPVVVIVAATARKLLGARSSSGAKSTGIPFFVILFVAAGACRGLGLASFEIGLGGTEKPFFEWAKLAGKILLGVALAAIGMGIDLRKLVRVGPRVLVCALAAVIAMVAVAVPLVRIWL